MKLPSNILPCMREWAANYRNGPEPTFPSSRRAAKAPLVYKPATELERRAIAAIAPGLVTYLPATAAKRFARQIQGTPNLTDSQRLYVWGIVWKFRRQVKDKELVAEAKRIGLGTSGSASSLLNRQVSPTPGRSLDTDPRTERGAARRTRGGGAVARPVKEGGSA